MLIVILLSGIFAKETSNWEIGEWSVCIAKDIDKKACQVKKLTYNG